MEKTPENLRKLRKETGLSMADFAKIAQTPYNTWQSWEAPPEIKYARPPKGIAFALLEQYLQNHHKS